MKKFLTGCLLGLLHTAAAQTSPVDVQHYRFELGLSDASDTITGTATVSVLLRTPAAAVTLDLANISTSGKGMQVLDVSESGSPLQYIHLNSKLRMQLPAPAAAGDTKTFTIRYKGIPADGLIISKSIHGKRTFFGDNWPNRAHNWLPCNDVPSDKARLEFAVTAPAHYSVVSNGLKQGDSLLNDSTRLTRWSEVVPLPTKVMVIGVADFAVGDAGTVNGIPVSSWVYREEKEKGFYDYAQAKEILQFFIDYIGPYGYKKLANVQSKTIFGGMENASAIFYFEESVTGKRTIEDLIAHEIAHQWFGNMVTETNFGHLWLSEGFATYMANIYIESKYGTDSLKRRLDQERAQVSAFAASSPMPVLDTTANYMSLLNANSYQKGSWILHMLRRTAGDAVFKKIIRQYYSSFAGRNASTDDFIAVAEKVSGKKLAPMLNQWLRRPGLPVLRTKWQYNARKKSVTITVEQCQAERFSFPLQVELLTAKGSTIHIVNISKQTTTISLPARSEVTGVLWDPGTNLLWSVCVQGGS